MIQMRVFIVTYMCSVVGTYSCAVDAPSQPSASCPWSSEGVDWKGLAPRKGKGDCDYTNMRDHYVKVHGLVPHVPTTEHM